VPFLFVISTYVPFLHTPFLSRHIRMVQQAPGLRKNWEALLVGSPTTAGIQRIQLSSIMNHQQSLELGDMMTNMTAMWVSDQHWT
jgi:hypothetical protein